MITQNQAIILNFIKENPYCDIEDIVDGCGVPKNAVSRMLHTLDDNEIIEFQSDMSTYGSHNSQGGLSCEVAGWIIKKVKE